MDESRYCQFIWAVILACPGGQAVTGKNRGHEKFKFRAVAMAMVLVCAAVSADEDSEDPGSDSKPGNVNSDCPPDVCTRVRCAGANEDNCPPSKGVIDPHGGICGCCSGCVPFIKEHEPAGRVVVGVSQGVPLD